MTIHQQADLVTQELETELQRLRSQEKNRSEMQENDLLDNFDILEDSDGSE